MNQSLRIVSLLSSATEILYGLGLGQQVVAVSHECDFPPQVRQKPQVTCSNVESLASSGDIDQQVKQFSAAGKALYEIDARRLVQLRPDWIVTQAQCDVCAVRYQDVLDVVDENRELSHTQVIALNPSSLEDILADITRIAQATGRQSAARDYVAGLRGRIEKVRSTTGSLPEEQRPRVACIEWIEPLMLAANWTPELLHLAGGYCPLTPVGQHSTYNAWSAVVQFDPEVILLAPCGFDLPRTVAELRPLALWPSWQQLSAVKSGRVFALDGNAYLNRSGPRLVDSLEIMAHLFHPQIFRLPPHGFGTPRPWQPMRVESGSLVAAD